jgi:class 3 adenylate cyclase/pimeloyl-ACP methyl ester carboxylesterase
VTRYVRNRDGQVAYQVHGAGLTVAALSGTAAGIAQVEDSLTSPFFERVSAFSRLVVHDARGSGRSDPLPGTAPTVQDQADDLAAVLDDMGFDRVVVWGIHAGAGAAVAFAAYHPDRIRGLFITNGWARLIQADDYPYGISPASSELLVDAHEQQFGTGMFAGVFSPSRADDPAVRAFYERIEQRGASRSQAMLLTRMAQEYDVRELLPRVHTPTIVMHNRDNIAVSVEHGRYLATHIPGARFVEFAGTDQLYFLEDPEPVLIELEAFVTGNRPRAPLDHAFLTILFTDLVTSTAHLAEVGDRRWRDLIDDYEREVTSTTERHGGRVIKGTGDGIVAVFPVPSRALRCAAAIAETSGRVGLHCRIGVHAAEVQLRGDDISGLGVNIAARVCALAEPTEVLATRTIKDILAGSGVNFTDRGTHTLKGVPDPWQLFAVRS